MNREGNLTATLWRGFRKQWCRFGRTDSCSDISQNVLRIEFRTLQVHTFPHSNLAWLEQDVCERICEVVFNFVCRYDVSIASNPVIEYYEAKAFYVANYSISVAHPSEWHHTVTGRYFWCDQFYTCGYFRGSTELFGL